MNRPSSTITAAALAGMGMSLFWELLLTFVEVDISAGTIALSVTFVSGVVGYLKKENVIKGK